MQTLSRMCHPPHPWMPTFAGMTIIVQRPCIFEGLSIFSKCEVKLHSSGEDGSHAVGAYDVAAVGSDVGGAVAL